MLASADAYRRLKRTGWWFPLFCCLWLHAQVPPATPAGSPATQGSEVRFRAIEVHEYREALTDILHRLSSERDRRREEHRAYVDAAAAAQALMGLADDDKLRRSIGLTAELDRIDLQLGDSRLRRLEVLDRIQVQANRADSASTEGARILRDTDAEIRQMLAQQEEQSRKLSLLRRQLTAFVNSIPPPVEFEAACGIPMRLIRKGPEVFYCSATAVPVSLYRRFLQAMPASPVLDTWTAHASSTAPEAPITGVSWYEARRFCQWLSAQEKVEYRLPTAEESAVLATAVASGGLAFWNGGIWIPEEHTARRDLKRFAIDLVIGWDPAARLTPQPGAFHEVPFARYPDLTVYLVTAPQTGIAHRWQRLKATQP